MSALRDRMLRDMRLRGFSPRTRYGYVLSVARLARFHHRSPDQIDMEGIRDYLDYLITKRGLAWSSINVASAAIRFFYVVTLGRPEMKDAIPPRKTPQRLPEILSNEELERLFMAPTHAKHRMLLMTAYAAGLRASETLGLRVTDIDSDRMMIRVNQGKGRKDRYTILSPRLLDIVRAYGEAYRHRHPVSPEQATVMRHLAECRTAALGGHRDVCPACDFTRVSYNSCRDRHCPKCQAARRAQWLQTRLERLLPVEYFHVVFTLPDELNPLVLRSRAALYSLLFRAASETLLALAADPKRLGAQVGFTAILHTWGQNLLFHPHLHCVVTGGGLASDAARWVPARQGYLLPVKVLGKLFRSKFLAGLQQLYEAGELTFGGSTQTLAQPKAFATLKAQLYGKDWVVYAKPPFGGAEHVFRTSAATPTEWPSPTRASCRWKTASSASATRTIPRAVAGRSCVCRPTNSSGASFSTCCPSVSSASATTVFWPAATSTPSSLALANSSRLPSHRPTGPRQARTSPVPKPPTALWPPSTTTGSPCSAPSAALGCFTFPSTSPPGHARPHTCWRSSRSLLCWTPRRWKPRSASAHRHSQGLPAVHPSLGGLVAAMRPSPSSRPRTTLSPAFLSRTRPALRFVSPPRHTRLVTLPRSPDPEPRSVRHDKPIRLRLARSSLASFNATVVAMLAGSTATTA